jgi:hypothetical protein
MITRIFGFLVCFFLITNIYAQSDSSNLRPSFELKLKVNSKQFYTAPLGETKYIINDTIIQIFPGEKLFIETNTINNKLVNLRRVDSIRDSTKTIIIEFVQESEGKDHKYMQLIIKNPYNKNLHYSVLMNLLKHQKWVRTNVVPVMPKLESIEMWPDILTSLVLTGFELKEK